MVTLRIRIPSRILRRFRENLGALFIVMFQALLLICTGLLIVGNAELANGVAIGAYFSLIIGVILQLASFLRHGKEGKCD